MNSIPYELIVALCFIAPCILNGLLFTLRRFK